AKGEDTGVFHTANGSATTNSVAWIDISESEENITPYVVSNAPPVLTVGYLCMEKGYSFYMAARQKHIAFVLMV
ncbi:MAG: hypothetical protein ACKPKO_51105, partial [Candidatus Fonsibacter sp.]